jgi:hypothetical protein
MKTQDDFNWETYTQDYYSKDMEYEFIGKKIPLIVSKVELDSEGELVFFDNLHANWKQLYYLIHKLKVNSIYECGCGCAHHLINNKIINPDLKINGCDYSQNQINLGFTHFKLDEYDFANNLKIVDMVNVKNVEELGKHEFVYTQAVTMHLSYERAKKFLYNMKELSSKYIFLIENHTVHDYNSLINEVFPEFRKIENSKYIDYGILLERI